MQAKRLWRYVCILSILISLTAVNGKHYREATVLASRNRRETISQFQPSIQSLPKTRVAFAAPLDSSHPIAASTLWFLRGLSAVTSYVGFVAFLDRPQGSLTCPERVAVRPSSVPGAGLGLFATSDLPKGTVLGTYPGVVIPLQQNLGKLRDYPPCEAYIWRFSDNAAVIDPTNPVGVLEDICRGGNPSTPGSQWLWQYLLSRLIWVPSTFLCRINEPPKGMDVNVIINEDLKSRRVTFSLERDVKAGEEFFIDYGFYYDRSNYSGG